MKYRGFFIGFGSLDEGKILDLNFFPGQAGIEFINEDGWVGVRLKLLAE